MNDRIVCTSREEWLEKRKYLIMASEAAVILGTSKFASPLDLWMEKRGIEKREVTGEHIEWGNRLEPLIADAYTDKTDRLIEDPGDFTIFQHPHHPWWGATPDRFIYDSERDSVGVLEIKNVTAWNVSEWSDGEVPLQYLIQVQHQMAACGCSWGSIAALIGGNTFIYQDIERDEDFLKGITPSLLAFWGRVTNNDPPPPDDTEMCSQAIARLFSSPTGESIALDNTVLNAHDQLEEIKERKKRLEADERGLKNTIKMAIGNNTTGVLPTGDYYTYETVHADGYEVKPKSYRRLLHHKRKGD